MKRKLLQCCVSVASILMIVQGSGAGALAEEAVLSPSDRGFIEKFNQAKCEKERAEAVDKKERTLKSLKAFELHSALTEFLSTSPG